MRGHKKRGVCEGVVPYIKYPTIKITDHTNDKKRGNDNNSLYYIPLVISYNVTLRMKLKRVGVGLKKSCIRVCKRVLSLLPIPHKKTYKRKKGYNIREYKIRVSKIKMSLSYALMGVSFIIPDLSLGLCCGVYLQSKERFKIKIFKIYEYIRIKVFKLKFNLLKGGIIGNERFI